MDVFVRGSFLGDYRETSTTCVPDATGTRGGTGDDIPRTAPPATTSGQGPHRLRRE